MNVGNNDRNNRRTARSLMVACGLLFSVFSFMYIYAFQRDLLEALHYTLSQGKTHYSPLFSATFITIAVLVVRWAINKLLNLKGIFYALSYFPSCLLLGVLLDVDYDVSQSGGISSVWTWLLPVLIVGYVGVGYLLKSLIKVSWGSFNFLSTFNVNLITLLLLCLMTIGIGNSDKNFHDELGMELSLKQGNYSKVWMIGEKSKSPSLTMTALRAYALSKEKQLGERLFFSPQLYGAEGLLFDFSKEKVLWIDNDSLSGYWGVCPKTGEGAVDFFRRLCKEETGSHVVLDYYLSALLLDKQLKNFVAEFDALYLVEDSVPRHYREAKFLYRKIYPSAREEEPDSVLEMRWLRYRETKEAEILRKEYGDTYWWYYQYE